MAPTSQASGLKSQHNPDPVFLLAGAPLYSPLSWIEIIPFFIVLLLFSWPEPVF